MLHRIAVSPQGSLGLVATGSGDAELVRTEDLSPELILEFNVSCVSGLAMLASGRWQPLVAAWPAEFTFWRDYARKYFAALCRQYSPRVKQWSVVEPPD